MNDNLSPLTTELELDIRFGIGGNGTMFQVTGWSFPEEEFTWSLGVEALLELPNLEKDREYIVLLEGAPFLHPPRLVEQVVRFGVAGQELFSFKTRQAFRRSFRVPATRHQRNGVVLSLGFPAASSPAAGGSSDQRVLAIAWKRIRLFKVVTILPRPERKLPPHEKAYLDYAQTSRIRSSKTSNKPKTKGSQTTFELAKLHLSENHESPVLETTASEALQSGNTLVAAKAISAVFGLAGLELRHDSSLPDDISVVRCGVNAGGKWTFHFSKAWMSDAGRGPGASMVVWHWLATLPLFRAYAESGRVPGSLLLSLGDEAHSRGVAFCSNDPDVLLIPDPYFLRSSGYREIWEVFRTTQCSFSSRQRVALWRGSTTGYRGEGGLLALPRIRLCMKAREVDVSKFLDVGLTSFVQLAPEEVQRLQSMNLSRPFVSPKRFMEWMFHIDIDGNTCSWPGLFTKLLAGGVVLKVASGQGWRQWYYDRLEAHVNFMPVAHDLSDLVDKVKFLSYSTSHSEHLAEAGRNLALSMSYEFEIDSALAVLECAIVCEWAFKHDR